MKNILYQILDEENFLEVPCTAYEQWVEDYEEYKKNVQYWKEHSKRRLTSEDLANFFGESDEEVHHE